PVAFTYPVWPKTVRVETLRIKHMCKCEREAMAADLVSLQPRLVKLREHTTSPRGALPSHYHSVEVLIPKLRNLYNFIAHLDMFRHGNERARYGKYIDEISVPTRSRGRGSAEGCLKLHK
ncbi:hypothetical protein FOL46_004520, partial [Perkinsus olseni]